MPQDYLDSALGQQNQKQKEDTLRQAVQEVFSGDRINLKANLTALQAVHLARAYAYADRYDSKLTKRVADALMELSVSVNAFGRKDLRTILAAAISVQTQDKDTMRKRIIGV